jgi:hypothetical protein
MKFIRKNLVAIVITLITTGHLVASPENTTDVKDWRIRTYQNHMGGIAYVNNKSDTVYIGVNCSNGSRNILFYNPDFMEFKGKRSIISKVSTASKSPILVFNDDYNNQYKLGLNKIRESSDGGDYYGFALGSTVKIPNGKTLESLDALNKVKNLLMSNKTVWIGYKNPKSKEYQGHKYSLSGSTTAIKRAYKIGKCK